MDTDLVDSAPQTASPPLMLVLAQVGFTPSPELTRDIATVKAELSKQGFPIADAKQQSSFSLSSQNSIPQVSQSSFWTFNSRDQKRSIVIAQNSVVVYDTAYGRFERFQTRMDRVLKTVAEVVGEECFVRTVALRYVSGYADSPTARDFLADGVRGISMDTLPKEHFHHNYNFWCSTKEGGKLVIGVKTVHGHQLPPGDISMVGLELDPKFVLERTEDAVQLDIHETLQEKGLQPFDVATIHRAVAKMRGNLKAAFLASTTTKAHQYWGIEK